MNCKCMESINKQIQESTSDPHAKLDTIYELPGMEQRLFLTYTYRKKKKDGTFTKEKTGQLALSKCPFCGKKIKEDES